jgi:circadian clock protein KaiB
MEPESITRTQQPIDEGAGITGARALLLRLYIAGSAPNSVLAEANLRTLLTQAQVNEYQLDVVDCIREPLRALQDGVFVTPMLLKLSPEPATSIVGSLSDRARVALALGVADRLTEGGGDA